MALAGDIDALVGLTFVWVLTGADLGVLVAVGGISAINSDALVQFASALSFSAAWDLRVVEAVIVSGTVDRYALVCLASLLKTTVTVGAAVLWNTLVILAKALSIGTSLDGVAHDVTSALDDLACECLSIAELIGGAVVIVSALFFLARVLVASPFIVVGLFAISVGVAVDFFANLVVADSVSVIVCAVSVFSAFDRFAAVRFADVGFSVTIEVLAVVVA